MTNEANTAPVEAEATGALVPAFDSESKTYDAVTEALGDARTVAADSAAVAKIIAAIVAVEGIDPTLPVFVAAKGEAIPLGEFDVAALEGLEGESGYTVSIVGTRNIEGEDGKKRNGLTSIAIYPFYSVDDILSHDKGKEYLQRLAEKEMGLVAFRNMRVQPGAPLAELAAGAAMMPATLGDFIERERQAGAGSAYAVFNDNWANFRGMLQKNAATAGVVKFLPNKADMLKCIRSQSYAEAHHSLLEEQDWFTKLATTMAHVIKQVQEQAESEGAEAPIAGDPNLILEWIAARDSVDLEVKPTAAASMELDLSAFGMEG